MLLGPQRSPAVLFCRRRNWDRNGKRNVYANDLGEEQIAILKASFTEMNEVEFFDAETAAGTRLLVARETGSDEDFVSILTIYKGYSVEFDLFPNPNAAVQELTDAQIRTGIDFLSDLDFIPAA